MRAEGQEAALRAAKVSNLGAVEVTNILDLLMLICASLGALAFGILSAYGILRVGFALMRGPRRPALLKTQPQTAEIS